MAYSDLVFIPINSASGSIDNFQIGLNSKSEDGKLYLTNNHDSVGVVELPTDVIATLLAVMQKLYNSNNFTAEYVRDVLKLALKVKYWDLPKATLNSGYDFALEDGVLTLDFVSADFNKARKQETNFEELFKGEVNFPEKFPILELKITPANQSQPENAGTGTVLGLWLGDSSLYTFGYYCIRVLETCPADKPEATAKSEVPSQPVVANQNVPVAAVASESVAAVPAHLAAAPEVNRSPTFWVEICIAGPVDVAKQVIRKHVAEVGLCVTVTPTDYLYSYGEESGYIVRLINYPRFPTTAEALIAKAEVLAQKLMVETAQGSFTLVTPVDTIFYSKRPQDQKK